MSKNMFCMKDLASSTTRSFLGHISSYLCGFQCLLLLTWFLYQSINVVTDEEVAILRLQLSSALERYLERIQNHFLNQFVDRRN